jgi:hypothetical protein
MCFAESVLQVSGTGTPGRKRQIFHGSAGWGKTLGLELVALYVAYSIGRRICREQKQICREKKQFSGATRMLVQIRNMPAPQLRKYAGNPSVRYVEEGEKEEDDDSVT